MTEKKKTGRPPNNPPGRKVKPKTNGIPITEKNIKGAGRTKIEMNFERIKKEINVEQVLYWIGLQATAAEIAGSFRVTPDTLDNRLREEFGCNFSELKKRLGGGAEGKLQLRRNQFKLSEHNASMAIWLGKQWLDQKDLYHQETKLMTESKVNIYLPENGRDTDGDTSSKG